MSTLFQKGQKVITPDGEALVEDILGDQVTVKFDSGQTWTYSADDLEDNSDQG
jgi:hypothetical protein